jgi:YfiH family protein
MIKTITPDWPAPSNVRAYTTTRHLALPSSRAGGDEAALLHNRQCLQAALSLPSQPLWLHQVHGTNIIALPTDNLQQTQVPEADGAFTQQADTVCAVVTADCLPVLLCNRQGNKVAAIHAGWRGLAAGIVFKAANLLLKEQSQGEFLAWLGPAIGPQAFEVGPEVRAQFLQLDVNTAQAFQPHRNAKTNDRWLANIYTLAKLQLVQAGISEIYGGQYCTYNQRDLFLSFRRGDPGNMASLIWFN